MALELRVISTIEAVSPEAWDACAAGHPFVQHAFLKALETSGAFGRERGVLPRHVLLIDAAHGLVACAPAMLKWDTLREFGQELHWLKTGVAADCFAWPKFQVGVPFFPVKGPKLLVRKGLPEAALQIALMRGLNRLRQREDQKSVFNVMHISEAAARLCQSEGALLAGELHSNWTNTGLVNWQDYLAKLPERKRYQLRKERRQANSHGLIFKVLRQHELTDEILTDYYEGHRRVCELHGGQPWLPASTYEYIVQEMAGLTVLMGYFDGSRFVAGHISMHSVTENSLYLLQWSDMEKLESMALDLICYRPIEYALEQGVAKLDSGLVAPHKLHRGWHKTPVYHAHWFHNDELKALAKKQLGRQR